MDRRVALLFPGQGSEEPEMGLALGAIDPRARRLLELASHHVGLDVARALERGGRAMSRTEVIQPALVAVGLGIARVLAERVAIDAVLGHSLGELTATALAVDLDDERAIALASARGRAMAEAASARPGGMLAVRAASDEALAPALACGVVLAAHNAPDERVIAGDRDALAAAERALAGSATRLAVAGAWHSPAMQSALEPFRRALDEHLAVPAMLRATLVSTVHGRPIHAHEIAGSLADGLVRPVRFVEALRALTPLGVTDLVAVAPSRVVRALARRTLGRSIAIHALDGPRDLEAIGVP